jgi:ABC-type multidrug transport system fused ATPase/permease subunit
MVHGTDKIMVMEHGCIIEYGKHEELMQKDGLYSKLIKAYEQTHIGSTVNMDRMEVKVG